MLRFSLLLVLALNSAGFALQVRLMSFNVMMPWGQAIGPWSARRAAVAEILRTHTPDVVASQELVLDRSGVNMVADVAYDSPQYAWYGVGRDGDYKDEGSFIFYRRDKYDLDGSQSGNFWFSSTPQVPSRFGGNYNRICTFVRLVDKASGQGFRVFSMHNYMPAEASMRMQAARLLQERVAAAAASGEPVWVAGDFNSSEGDAVAEWLKNGNDNPLKLRDTYRVIHPTGAVNTGFGTKFDYVWQPADPSGTYSVSNAWVVSSPVASDHYPIVADVVWGHRPPTVHTLPGRIAAAEFAGQSGVQVESCSDADCGYNVGYLDPGDWITYRIQGSQSRTYGLRLRHAGVSEHGRLRIVAGSRETIVDLPPTGDWQGWSTHSAILELDADVEELRLEVLSGGFNLHWIELSYDLPVHTTAPTLLRRNSTSTPRTWDLSGRKTRRLLP